MFLMLPLSIRRAQSYFRHMCLETSFFTLLRAAKKHSIIPKLTMSVFFFCENDYFICWTILLALLDAFIIWMTSASSGGVMSLTFTYLLVLASRMTIQMFIDCSFSSIRSWIMSYDTCSLICFDCTCNKHITLNVYSLISTTGDYIIL